MATRKYEHLTPEQVNHFLEKGWVRIPAAFTTEQSAQFTEDLWIRIGLDPNDKSGWPRERLHLPRLRVVETKEFSPKAWGAMCDLLGGEERINPNSGVWGDSFIINLGTPEDELTDISPRDLDNWHCDGDFFRHFLDSPEQALLVIPIFSKILPGGGGTYIAPDSVAAIARRLLSRPTGLLPGRGTGDDNFDFMARLAECNEFEEMTGDVGDCILLHPLMLHSASKNCLRIPRIITNPPVSLKEPFKFNRDDPSEFSLVELKTLRALGVEKLDYVPSAPREKIVPARRLAQVEMKKLELERIREHALKHGKPVPEICNA